MRRFSYLYIMLDERAYELLTSQLGLANEEKAALRKQLEQLTVEINNMSSSHKEEVCILKENTELLKENITSLKKSVDDLNITISIQSKMLETKDTAIEALKLQIQEQALQLKNQENMINNGRKHRFARSSEQARLLNNREVDTVAQGKADFDGAKMENSSDKEDEDDRDGSSTASSGKPEIKNRTVKKPRSPKKKTKVDKTVVHEVDSYYNLPEGARFIYREGEMDVTCYRVIEHVKAYNVEHIYKVARVQLADGSFVNTMKHPLGRLGGIFSPTLLAQIIGWKYAYHLPLNRIRKLLADQGVHIGKSTINKYIQDGMTQIRSFFEAPFKKAVQDTDYLMIDETTELVGVKEEDTMTKAYRKKYLWAFFAKLKKMVYYVYENGSRGGKIVRDFLEYFRGAISTDGYVGYQIFDDDERYPYILHIGCWTHTRRLFVEAIESDKRARDMVSQIGELFTTADTHRLLELSPKQLEEKRKHDFGIILSKIKTLARKFEKDTQLMANPLMAKAVNYMLNQWKSLENITKCGYAEISNNLCEQRMKTVKLNLKNCQNIGSEEAAKNATFMFAITESCSLNGVKPVEYIKHLLDCICNNSKQDKTSLLPCFYKSEC